MQEDVRDASSLRHIDRSVMPKISSGSPRHSRIVDRINTVLIPIIPNLFHHQLQKSDIFLLRLKRECLD